MDRVQLQYPKTLAPEDVLTLSDTISILWNLGVSTGDIIEWLDLAGFMMAEENTMSGFSDSFTMGDSVSVSLSTDVDDYTRRYLQDRNFMIGDKKTHYCDSLYISDRIEVEVV